MLRSFDYAGATALMRAFELWPGNAEAFVEGVGDWQRRTVAAFLDGYRAAEEGEAPLWPDGRWGRAADAADARQGALRASLRARAPPRVGRRAGARAAPARRGPRTRSPPGTAGSAYLVTSTGASCRAAGTAGARAAPAPGRASASTAAYARRRSGTSGSPHHPRGRRTRRRAPCTAACRRAGRTCARPPRSGGASPAKCPSSCRRFAASSSTTVVSASGAPSAPGSRHGASAMKAQAFGDPSSNGRPGCGDRPVSGPPPSSSTSLSSEEPSSSSTV